MDTELREQFLQFLREELTIDVTTKSVYSGDMFNDSMYSKVRTLNIMLGNEVISSICLDS